MSAAEGASMAGALAAGSPEPPSIGSLRRYQRMRRFVLGALIAVLVTLLLFGQSSFPPESLVHEAVEMAGIILIVLGIAGRLWCTLYIGGRKAAEIVTGGPYSISRNPLYLFSSVAAAGFGAQMGSILAAVGFALLCALAFHVVIRREERFLAAEFGETFADYVGRVPRFLPNLSLYQEGAPAPLRPDRLLRTLLDGLVFFVAMPLFELIDAAQLDGTLPVLFHLP